MKMILANRPAYTKKLLIYVKKSLTYIKKSKEQKYISVDVVIQLSILHTYTYTYKYMHTNLMHA